MNIYVCMHVYVSMYVCMSPSTSAVQPTDPSEVRRHILSLKPRTAPENDGISTVILRHLSKHAVQHLALLLIPSYNYSTSLQSGKQPKSFPYINRINPPKMQISTVPLASLAQSVNFLNASSPPDLLHSLIRIT